MNLFNILATKCLSLSVLSNWGKLDVSDVTLSNIYQTRTMKNCCDSLVKYFLVLVNCVFALIGLILICFGGYAQYAAKEFLEFLGRNYVQHYNHLSIAIIVLGKTFHNRIFLQRLAKMTPS